MLLRAVPLPGPPLWLGVQCFCVGRLHGRACVLVCGPPPWSVVRCSSVTRRHDWLCRLVPGPPQWSGVLCWCVARTHGRACCGRAEPAAAVGRMSLRLVRCLSIVGGTLTSLPAPLNVGLPPQQKWADTPCPWDPATCTIRHLALHGAFRLRCSRGPTWSHSMYRAVGGNTLQSVSRYLALPRSPTGALQRCVRVVVLLLCPCPQDSAPCPVSAVLRHIRACP